MLTNARDIDCNWALPKLREFNVIENGTVMVRQASGVFENCPTLETLDFIPDTTSSSLTAITAMRTFRNCMSLKSVPAFDAMVGIGESYCENCTSLQSVAIPAAVTTIGANAFANCYSLASITFLPTTPPTVDDASAWTNLPTTCEIHVPSGTLADYQAAANYPDPATYTYVEDAE